MIRNKASFHPMKPKPSRWIFCFPRLCGSVVESSTFFGIRRLLFKQLGPANVHPSLPFLQADQNGVMMMSVDPGQKYEKLGICSGKNDSKLNFADSPLCIGALSTPFLGWSKT